MYYVYMHVNKINDKKYIGITNNPKRRWRSNGIEYRPRGKNENKNRYFYNAIEKYGWENFDSIILGQVGDFEVACKFEILFIRKFKTMDKKYGYNISKGGNGGLVYREHPRNMLGKPQTEYQKRLKRKQMLNHKINPMKNGQVVWGKTHDHPRGMAGKEHTDEHKQNVSKTMIEKNVNCKSVIVTYPNGDVKTFRSTGEAEAIGLTKPVILKIIRSGKPYAIKVINQYTEKIKHLEGITITYQDDTEITN